MLILSEVRLMVVAVIENRNGFINIDCCCSISMDGFLFSKGQFASLSRNLECFVVDDQTRFVSEGLESIDLR